MRKWLAWALGAVVVLAVIGFVLDRTWLLLPIFGRVFLIYWPFSHVGGVPARKAGCPPGQFSC